MVGGVLINDEVAVEVILVPLIVDFFDDTAVRPIVICCWVVSCCHTLLLSPSCDIVMLKVFRSNNAWEVVLLLQGS